MNDGREVRRQQHQSVLLVPGGAGLWLAAVHLDLQAPLIRHDLKEAPASGDDVEGPQHIGGMRPESG